MLSELQVDHSWCRSSGACEDETTCIANMGLINKVDMVCLSPVGYGV